MTAQVADSIIIDGVNLNLLTNPLDEYLKTLPEKPKFDVPSTACWRGYVAQWALDNNSLYLTDLNGSIGCKKMNVGHFFSPDGVVKADWYTGVLRIPVRPTVYYIHGGYASLYPKELLIYIDKGNVDKIMFREREIDKYTFEITSELEFEIYQDEMRHEVLCYRVAVEQKLYRVYHQHVDDDFPF